MYQYDNGRVVKQTQNFKPGDLCVPTLELITFFMFFYAHEVNLYIAPSHST